MTTHKHTTSNDEARAAYRSHLKAKARHFNQSKIATQSAINKLMSASVDTARAVTRADRQCTLKNSGLLQTSEERRVQYEARKALLALKPQDVIKVYWIGNRAFPSILESAENERREQVNEA